MKTQVNFISLRFRVLNGFIVKIDYSTYSLKDLVDVKNRIDVERFPENYDDLLNELERRRRSGHVNGFYNKQRNLSDGDDDNDNTNEGIIFEFGVVGHKKRRITFLTAFFVFNLVMLAIVLPKYSVKSLSSVHKYNTLVSSLKCIREEIENEDTDAVSVYYDLAVISHDDKFTAFEVGKRMCNVLSRDFKVGDDITIWHHEGIVYQLKAKSRMLLSYKYLKPRIRAVQTLDTYFYWFGLFMFWVVLFKSFVNAMSPGTFTKN